MVCLFRYIILAILIAPLPALAIGRNTAHAASGKFGFWCNFDGETAPAAPSEDLRSDDLSEDDANEQLNGTVERLVKTILGTAGVSGTFDLRPTIVGDTGIAYSALRDAEHGKDRYLLYNPAFFKKVASSGSRRPWPQLLVLAHEIAHHLNGDTLLTEFEDQESFPKTLDALQYTYSYRGKYDDTDWIDNPDVVRGFPPYRSEAEADRFAGSTLYKLGIGDDELRKVAASVFREPQPTMRHPSADVRVDNVLAGWKSARNKLPQKADIETVEAEKRKKQAALDALRSEFEKVQRRANDCTSCNDCADRFSDAPDGSIAAEAMAYYLYTRCNSNNRRMSRCCDLFSMYFHIETQSPIWKFMKRHLME